jgi:hypothetical protein
MQFCNNCQRWHLLTWTCHLRCVQVTKATEDQRLDQHRMLLGINHRGNIVSVNAGASRSLFSFEGQQLVGQPLSSAIDIFTDWKQGHGEELSLLELLVGQLMASDPAATKVTTVCASWRVGVHRPAASGHADQPVRIQQLFSKPLAGCM